MNLDRINAAKAEIAATSAYQTVTSFFDADTFCEIDAFAKSGDGFAEVVAGFGTVEGLPESLDLGPRGMPPAAFDCKLMPSASGETNLTLVLTGVFNGKRSSKLVVPVQWKK